MILETGLQYLDGLAANSRGDWSLQSELAAAYQRIGDVYGDVRNSNLGNTTAALASYRKALSLLDSVTAHDPADRNAATNRVMIHYRVAGIHGYTRNTREGIASLQEAGRLGEELRARYPADDAIRRQVAKIHIDLGDLQRLAGEHAAAFEENSKGLALLLESAESHPGDRSLQYSLSGAYSNIGMVEVRLGRLREGLDHYEKAAAQMEELVRLDPANVSYQRELMYAYAHVGDALGSPNLLSLGDTAGAIAAYRKLVEIGRRLYDADPADQRVASDYGGALSRLAAAFPDDQLPANIGIVRESVRVLREIARVNPQNLLNRSDLAFSYGQLGDALRLSGDRAGAVRAYREGLSLLETLLNNTQRQPAIVFLEISRKLAEDAARQGERAQALEYARRALEVGDPAGRYGKGRPAAMQLFLTPRGLAAMGFTYAALAQQKGAIEDRREAAAWLEKSLAAWHEAQADPAFAAPHRRGMQQVEAALAALKRH